MNDNRQLEFLRFVERVVRGSYADATGCLLFGSRQGASSGKDSDVDLFLFGRSLQGAFHEHYHVEGWLFDVYTWSSEEFLSLTRQQLADSNRYFLDALRGGRILFDHEGIVADMREKTSSLSPYFPAKPREWMGKRLLLTCLLNDARSPSSGIDAMACHVDLYRAVLHVKALRHQLTMGPLKVIAQHLEALDSTYAHGLHEALARAMGGEADPLMAYAEGELSALGGSFSSRERIRLHASI